MHIDADAIGLTSRDAKLRFILPPQYDMPQATMPVIRRASRHAREISDLPLPHANINAFVAFMLLRCEKFGLRFGITPSQRWSFIYRPPQFTPIRV